MSEITCEVRLPSNGKLYGGNIQFKNELRAPRLRDRGLGSSVRANKLQADILDKTLVQPLGMSTYDLHTADFVYLNWMQRRLSKGNQPYKISVTCPHCGTKNVVSVDLTTLPVKVLDSAPAPKKFTTLDGHEVVLKYITPRMLDDSVDKAQEYLSEYPECGLSQALVESIEFGALLIDTIDGESLTEITKFDFVSNMYQDDFDKMFALAAEVDWGVQLSQTTVCQNSRCRKQVRFTVPVG